MGRGGRRGGRGGGGGGGRGNRGGRGGGGRGNFNDGGNLYCHNCGNNRSHITKDCRKGGYQHSQSNRVDKHNNQTKNNRHNNNNDGRNSNGNGNRNNNSDPCTRCGLRGHNRKICNAKEVPDDQECECGCAFHRSNQCPWNNDPIEREEADSQATGMICQWCKDAGDGMHVYEDCKKPREFRVQLLKNINRAYDEIKWCWHCSSTSHSTRACTATPSEQGKTKWNAAISNIIDQWLKYDFSSYEARYRDNDEDVPMVTAVNSQRPPEPADYKWCILCEEFGHFMNNGSRDCNQAEYDQRSPPQFRNQATAVRQSYVPPSFSNAATTSTYESPNVNTTSFFHKCVNPICHANIGPWLIPAPRLGQSIICRKCGVSNSHPSADRRDSKIELLRLVAQLLDKRGGSGSSDEEGRKCKKSIIDAIKNPYLKRPSMALSKKLAFHRWPERQPQYTDLTMQLGKAEVFKNNGSYFNEPGNHQTYFPAAKFRVTENMVEICNNNELFINRAGRLGLRLCCLTCGMPAMVADDEGDLVMCGTDGMCTVGCGPGSPFWVDEYGAPRQRCRCLPVIGQVPNVAWIAPPR